MEVKARQSGPVYSPPLPDFDDSYNILKLAEIHAFEEGFNSENYCREIGEQINSYDSKYGLDELWILGDTGSSNDVHALLDTLDGDYGAIIVAGDEDKVKPDNDSKPWTGFFEQIGTDPWNVDIPYEVFDEGFEKQIGDWTIQAAHHPHHIDREPISLPDTRNPDVLDENFFSVTQDLNQNTLEGPAPSLNDADTVFYDHVHMPYTRTLEDTAIIGLGGRRHNYQLKSDGPLPARSLHLTIIDGADMHEMHFDAGSDQIYEHVVFNREEGEMSMYDAALLTEGKPDFWKPIQSRFHRSHFSSKAKETEDQWPESWIPE